MAGSMNKYLAELLGTFVLVLVGTLTVLNVGGAATGGGVVAISLGFGLAVMAGIYMFGAISGAHFNPAVTLAMFLKKDTSSTDLVGYWIAQVAGAVLASGLVAYAAGGGATGKAAVDMTRNTFSGEAVNVMLLEAILTAIFVMVILRSTAGEGKAAAFAIPMALVAIHLAAINLTGASVNPARSLGPAIIATEMADIWVYIAGPLLGGVVGFYLDKFLNSDS